jgi:hypothetical protein
MTVSVTKTLLFTSGQINFSDLRSSFKESSTGSISASELRRNTSTSSTGPVVPDATENAAVSTANNLNLSQFRNTIKYYDLTQAGTDLNVDVAAQTWNSNLTKNVVKRVNINGTCGSNSVASPALTASGTFYNLFLIVNGYVRGAGGAGGGADAVGGNGGTAMNLSSSGNAITVLANSGSQIYGGGGGGGGGHRGSDSATGSCYYYSYYSTSPVCSFGGCNGCNGGDTTIRGCYSISRCYRRGNNNNQSDCRHDNPYTVAAVAGGAGGTGGLGQGHNQTLTAGGAGSPGSTTSCAPNNTYSSSTSGNGTPGGNGGDWATSGFASSFGTAGGSPGRAISGSNYTIDANSSSASFKGLK